VTNVSYKESVYSQSVYISCWIQVPSTLATPINSHPSSEVNIKKRKGFPGRWVDFFLEQEAKMLYIIILKQKQTKRMDVNRIIL
jgi:hypothetical protein